MAACFWALSVLAGYAVTRHANPWLAILPTGIAIFIIHTFDALIPRYAAYLAVYYLLCSVCGCQVGLLTPT